jgi:hypothetical protein
MPSDFSEDRSNKILQNVGSCVEQNAKRVVSLLTRTPCCTHNISFFRLPDRHDKYPKAISVSLTTQFRLWSCLLSSAASRNLCVQKAE